MQTIPFSDALAVLFNCDAIIINDEHHAVTYPSVYNDEWHVKYETDEGIFSFVFTEQDNPVVKIHEGMLVWKESNGKSEIEIKLLYFKKYSV